MRTRLSLKLRPNEPIIKCLQCNLEMKTLLKLRNKRVYGCIKCGRTSYLR